jgi:hypothetical protein
VVVFEIASLFSYFHTIHQQNPSASFLHHQSHSRSPSIMATTTTHPAADADPDPAADAAFVGDPQFAAPPASTPQTIVGEDDDDDDDDGMPELEERPLVLLAANDDNEEEDDYNNNNISSNDNWISDNDNDNNFIFISVDGTSMPIKEPRPVIPSKEYYSQKVHGSVGDVDIWMSLAAGGLFMSKPVITVADGGFTNLE